MGVTGCLDSAEQGQRRNKARKILLNGMKLRSGFARNMEAKLSVLPER